MINKIILEILAYFFLFLIPGYFIYRLLDIKKRFSWIDQILLVAPLSLFYNYYLYLFLNFFRIPINQRNLIFGASLSIFISLLSKRPHLSKENISKFLSIILVKIKDYKTWILLVIFLSLIIPRVIFIFKNPYPHTTDMSHHIYQAKRIISFGKIFDYPNLLFVVGEHIFLSFVPIFSNSPILSYIPLLSLMLINILTILVLFRISYYITKKNYVSYLTLFLLSFWLIYSRSQLNFILGGVVGNTLGYFLIANSIFSTILLFRYKQPGILLIFVANVLVLIYSHTLSVVLALFIFFFAFLFYFLLNFQNLVKITKTFFQRKKIVLILLFSLTIFILYVPKYLLSDEPQQRMVKMPQSVLNNTNLLNLKIENLGPVNNYSIAFYLLALVGAIQLIKKRKNNVESFLLLSWFFIPLIYTLEPHFFLIRMIPDRTVNYIYYPLALLASLSFTTIKRIKKFYLLGFVLITLIINFSLSSYFSLNNKNELFDYREKELNIEAFQYLGNIIHQGENVFTEHLNSGIDDAAIKNYIPLECDVSSRTFWKRYERGLSLNTWKMMENPDENIILYKEKNIHYVVLPNKKNKYQKFVNSNYFSNIFENEKIVIYEFIPGENNGENV